jgi:hypothetical protein
VGERSIVVNCFGLDADPPLTHGATGTHLRAGRMPILEQLRVLGGIDAYQQNPVSGGG